MNRRTTRGLAVASALVVSSTLLAGCADELPQPQAGEAFSGPVLTEEQDTQVFTAVADTVAKADKALKSDALKPRVSGPAYEVRKSQLAVAKKRDNAEFVTDIPSESQQMIIPTTEGWPRTSFSITSSTEDLETPRLVAFEQASARSDYKMWSWVQLIPGQSMPSFADATMGSEAVAADDDSLAASPVDTGRCSALTMPAVTVELRPSGEPIATTPSPTTRRREDPSAAGDRPLASRR